MSVTQGTNVFYGTYKEYNFTCAYCGFDGRRFDNWMQLSIDHVRPQAQDGDDNPENLVVACQSCNSITSRMKFKSDMQIEEIFRLKLERVSQRRKEFFDQWLKNVVPYYLDKPAPGYK